MSTTLRDRARDRRGSALRAHAEAEATRILTRAASVEACGTPNRGDLEKSMTTARAAAERMVARGDPRSVEVIVVDLLLRAQARRFVQWLQIQALEAATRARGEDAAAAALEEAAAAEEVA